MASVRYGADLLWGPLAIEEPGLYELAFDVEPVADTPSRWFVRLETPDGEEIDRTRTIDPADAAAGPRRMRFMYHLEEPIAALIIRVKSEMGQALSAGRATLRQVGVDSGGADPGPAERPAGNGRPAFHHRAELPGGISLYEVPDVSPLIYWAESIETVPDLVTAIERLHAGATEPGIPDTHRAVIEHSDADRRISVAQHATVRFSGSAGHDLTAAVQSSNGGLLVFNASCDPGWQATIDGQVVTMLRVNAVCQGVEVPPGQHEVVFKYRPKGLNAGIALSTAGLLVLLGGFGLVGRNKRISVNP